MFQIMGALLAARLTTRSMTLAEDYQERDFSRKFFLTADVL